MLLPFLDYETDAADHFVRSRVFDVRGASMAFIIFQRGDDAYRVVSRARTGDRDEHAVVDGDRRATMDVTLNLLHEMAVTGPLVGPRFDDLRSAVRALASIYPEDQRPEDDE